MLELKADLADSSSGKPKKRRSLFDLLKKKIDKEEDILFGSLPLDSGSSLSARRIVPSRLTEELEGAIGGSIKIGTYIILFIFLNNNDTRKKSRSA